MDFRLGQEPWNGIEPWTVYMVALDMSFDLNEYGEPCSDGQELAALIEELRTERCFSNDSETNDEMAARLTYEATHGEYLAPGQVAAEQSLERQFAAESNMGRIDPDPTFRRIRGLLTALTGRYREARQHDNAEHCGRAWEFCRARYRRLNPPKAESNPARLATEEGAE